MAYFTGLPHRFRIDGMTINGLKVEDMLAACEAESPS